MSEAGLLALIGRYGYAAVFAGALFEGETMLILGGLAAHRGYLHAPGVALAAFTGGMIGDQISYWLGRRYGARALARLHAPAPAVSRVQAWVQRSAPAAIVANRFLYGLRTIGPMVIGMSGVPPLRFALFNAIGAALWAIAIVGGGYLFGRALEALLGDLRHYEGTVFVAVLAAGVAAWFWLRPRLRQGSK